MTFLYNRISALRDIYDAWAGELAYDPGLVRAPVVIIRGEWDRMSSEADAKWLFDALKASPLRRIVSISRGTHLMHLEENRFALYRAAQTFLAGNEAAAGYGQAAASNGRQPMFAVIFEVQPKHERFDDYLDLAKYLNPKLTAIDGFIDNERFESKRSKGRLLSLSTWRDEKAVVRWRTQGDHHAAQQKGRLEIFQNYRLRVGEVTDDTDPPPGIALLQRRFDETANVEAKAASITQLRMHASNPTGVDPERLGALFGLDPRATGLIDHEVFESIYSQGKLLLLIAWADGDAAAAWMPNVPRAAKPLRHRRVRIIRDYGMSDRCEAPQFFPDVKRAHGALE